MLIYSCTYLMHTLSHIPNVICNIMHIQYVSLYIFNAYKFDEIEHVCTTCEIITTIKVIDMPITSQSFLVSLGFFCLLSFCFVIRKLNMRSTDSILLSTQCSTVNCRCYVVQQISRTYSSCITENSYLLNTRFPLP